MLDEYDINRVASLLMGLTHHILAHWRIELMRIQKYDKQIAFYKHNYPFVYDLQFLQQNMFVIPVPLSKEYKTMLAYTKELMEYQNGYVAIHPSFTKLITSLSTAAEKGDGTLEKDFWIWSGRAR